MAYDGHYFIGNNGIFALLLEEKKYEKLVEINIHNAVLSSFPVLDVFVKVAAHLARNGSMDVIGRSFTDLKELTEYDPLFMNQEDNLLEVLFILIILET